MSWKDIFKPKPAGLPQSPSLPQSQQASPQMSLTRRLEQEKQRIEREEAEAPARAARQQAEWEQQLAEGAAELERKHLSNLKRIVKDVLGVDINPQKYPVQIDGLWLDYREKRVAFMDEGVTSESKDDTLLLLRPCDKCGSLRPAFCIAWKTTYRCLDDNRQVSSCGYDGDAITRLAEYLRKPESAKNASWLEECYDECFKRKQMTK